MYHDEKIACSFIMCVYNIIAKNFKSFPFSDLHNKSNNSIEILLFSSSGLFVYKVEHYRELFNFLVCTKQTNYYFILSNHPNWDECN